MVKKSKYQVPDEHLFRQEMDGVVPLKTRPTTDSKAPRDKNCGSATKIIPGSFKGASAQSVEEQAYRDEETGSSHRKTGIQKRTMQRLKRGRFPVCAQIDLHNMTANTGQKSLLEFINEAQNRSFECVRIIHGKGLRSESEPKLKLMTRRVLRDHPQVLAFTSCKPAHGGDGAVDVLLKLKNR